ncbi:efflux RND transporter periplasmic adaptor subunit [Kocuria palustris]|nr:efflux RND transporter periplasmic adaptor subunit [Kocuria palustris]
MDPLKTKYTPWQRMMHRWKARRDIPFRKKFFCGYDLHGNTYWEFTLDGNMQRLRRKMEPWKPLLFKSDYFETVPPQWLQWLRRTRFEAPTLEELINDQVRQQKIKVLAAHAESKWYEEKQRLEEEQKLKLQQELDRAKQDQEAYLKQYEQEQAEKHIPQDSTTEEPVLDTREKQSGKNNSESEPYDPWKQAEESKHENPVEAAAIKPRR